MCIQIDKKSLLCLQRLHLFVKNAVKNYILKYFYNLEYIFECF